jgi:hypothetical protein
MDDRKLLEKIFDKVSELSERQAVHNNILATHEARSLELQKRQDMQAERMKPIETHVQWVNIVLKTAGAVLVGFAVHALTKVILK